MQEYPLGSLPAYIKIARQKVSATKSGNGLQKTLQTISIWRWLLFILFFYFSVVLVVIREKSLEIRGFLRKPARQRDSNRGCNGLSFSEWKLHLFCDLHKAIHRFSDGLPESVAGFSRSQPFCLPYSENILGFGKYRQRSMHWFIISLISRISHCFGSSKAWFKASL